jgi:uncharacterized protein YabN with tetrapyrrole methylase and pyrophosphatase domain
MQSGKKLVVCGTGLKVGHITMETEGHVRTADKVFYLVADPVTEYWIKETNRTAESLHDCYKEGQARLQSYREMITKVMNSLEQATEVCVLFYGHPGIFVYPSHKMISLAKERGFEAEMLPGVSAEDCLFADLGIDPSTVGCQSYEATDFLVFHREFSNSSSLILWQVGVVGVTQYSKNMDYSKGIKSLVDRLLTKYPENHKVTVYEASQYIITAPRIEQIQLLDLLSVKLTPISTLYIPTSNNLMPDDVLMQEFQITKWSAAFLQKCA